MRDVFKMNHSLKKTISLVIPVYNEAANIELLYKELNATLLQIRHAYEFIFVDDGSLDSSLSIIKQLAEKDHHVFYIELSRNFRPPVRIKGRNGYGSG